MTSLAIHAAGLVTGVGLDLASSCAAIRCGITAFKETHFVDQDGEPILGAEVPLDQPWRGRDRLLRMAGMAIAECLDAAPVSERAATPILLVVSEQDRPGRSEGLDDTLLDLLGRLLRLDRHRGSGVLARGRVGGVEALLRARGLLEQGHQQILIAGVDCLLSAPALHHFEVERRLLTSGNSNGFIPGEGAAAILVRPDSSGIGTLVCRGIGLGDEPADRDRELPFRAEGLSAAIRAALKDGGLSWRDVDYRVADVSGEQRAFKEASLAISRLMRERKETFTLWHHADCVGEIGAASVPCAVAIALVAARKGYAPGPGVLCHFASDDGRRGAIALRAQEER